MIARKTLSVVGIIVGVIFVALAAFQYYSATKQSVPIPITFENLIRAKELPSTWVQVHAVVEWKKGIHDSSELIDGKPVTYYPAVDSSWDPKAPVFFFVRQPQESAALPSTQEAILLEGVLDTGGLAGNVFHEFQNRGINIAEKNLVLNWGQTPNSKHAQLWLFAGVILIAMALGLRLLPSR